MWGRFVSKLSQGDLNLSALCLPSFPLEGGRMRNRQGEGKREMMGGGWGTVEGGTEEDTQEIDINRWGKHEGDREDGVGNGLKLIDK